MNNATKNILRVVKEYFLVTVGITLYVLGWSIFLVPNNLEAFANCLRELIHDPKRAQRVGLQASHSIVRSWEDGVGEVLERYNRLIAKQKLIVIP